MNYFKSLLKYNIKDKSSSVEYYIRYSLDRCQRMHLFENLPDSIPKRILTKYLHTFGHVVLAKGPDGSLLAYRANPGHEPNFYNEGTKVELTSHLPGHNRTAVLGEDAVLVRNDSDMIGLMPIIEKYSVLLAECDLTQYNELVWSRVPFILAADDDKAKKSAEIFLENIEKGELSIITTSSFTEGITMLPYQHPQGRIKELIELRATLKAQFYEELGLNINGNMKREYVSSDEISQSDPSVLPFIEDMTENIETGLQEANKLFGTDMHVTENSAWAIQSVMAYSMTNPEEQTEEEPSPEITEEVKESNDED